ncbi:Hypothetical predicted protein [Lecanosticta acicola]|uniref:Uncharacterized protein n=1 Tax=Lecanosticta acicola TaxID=111012 RepID=A0AAI9E7X5_9PEZI|nr:Hypothetical predicted protein [Lecanosticta acicola]
MPALHPLHTAGAWHHDHQDKPLPRLPDLPDLPSSPTLTNPDCILPDTHLPALSSPPAFTRRRPPSPTYLRDDGAEHPTASSSAAAAATMGKKEKLGLMSKKMMLLRSRTASSGHGHNHSNPFSRSTPSRDSNRSNDPVPSSPVLQELQDVGNLAPEQHDPEPKSLQPSDPDGRRNSGESSSSDISGMTAFLARYEKPDGASDDEALSDNGGSPVLARGESNGVVEADMDAERLRLQQEEYNSAVLSKRAEQILANAKKRLMVMEGNLRGARDLVAPLTAANLKRATSLGSATNFSPAYGLRYAPNGYHSDHPSQSKMLHTQSSSPTMRHDYQAGHSRGFSEIELPARPSTALDRHFVMPRSVRTGGGRGHAIVPTYGALRGSRSFDSLGASSGVGYGLGRERPLHARASPDSNHLDPLPEDEEGRRSNRASREAANNGLGIYRPSSRTSDLREQLSNLKGKISTLKERAREDSLRRQSHSNLRNPSPFNNALAAAPDFFYTASSGYASPVLDTNCGIGYASNGASPVSARVSDDVWQDDTPPLPGSRKGSAAKATAGPQFGIQQARVVEIRAPRTADSKYQVRPRRNVTPQPSPPTTTAHGRTPSGTAIVGSAKDQSSYHQHMHSQDSKISSALSDHSPDDEPTEDENDGLGVRFPGLTSNQYGSSPISSDVETRSEQDYAPSEDEVSVYEDAQNEQNAVIAHEDREDAFDYEHFFLHSALGTYGHSRGGSDVSETSTLSAATARLPAAGSDEDDEVFNPSSGLYPPPTPETPERLREIERSMHRRNLSDESISTLNTYATADEVHSPMTPIEEPNRRLGGRERGMVVPFPEDIPQAHPGGQTWSRPASRAGSRLSSRPRTAAKRNIRRGSSSDRADSGVGISSNDGDLGRPAQPHGSMTPKPTRARPLGSIVGVNTPPMSPPGVTRRDPATLAVDALLDPEGKSLGLRNKAILFSVVESLRKVVHQLQEEDDTQYESRMLRRRLEEAKQALDGLAGH